jgi:signal transduction histidine kinase
MTASSDERGRAVVDAVVAIGADLDLHATLQRIVKAAAMLADARYAALGVLDDSGIGLADFITVGLTQEQRDRIGTLPRGHGILGLLITDARPLRLHDLRAHPAAYGFPAEHPAMASFLGVPVRVGSRVFGNLYLTEKRSGDDFTAADEESIIALAAAAGVAVEHARLFEQASRRGRWLEATAEIQQHLLGHVDRAAALSLIATLARETAGGDLALVVLAHPDESLRVEAASGHSAPALSSTLPRQGALADVVDRGATIHLDQGVHVPGVADVTSALLVPFSGADGARGALLVGATHRPPGDWLREDDVQAVRSFASQVALALDRAQAQEDRGALAVLADRERIARDLHDLVIQRLFATGLTLQGAERLTVPSEVTGRIRTAVDDLDHTIRDIRQTIFELHRPADDASLKGQISNAVDAARHRASADLQLELIGPLDSSVPDDVRGHVVAVVVEALSNATRHSAARHVVIRVAVEDEPEATVVVDVRDDGVGFTAPRPGSGLRNMGERAREVQGTVRIDSSAGEGTSVRWMAPLSRAGQPPTTTSPTAESGYSS